MSWNLAQLNIATLIAPLDSPVLADFVAELDRINYLADHSQGFVWRFQTDDSGTPDSDPVFSDELIVNLSVWTSVDELHNFTYRTAHAQVMSRRKEWFEQMNDAYSVLWWVPEGHRPALAEARQRLDFYRKNGPGPDAFTFKKRFAEPLE